MTACSACTSWLYQGTEFSKPEGERMTGWCRIAGGNTNQSFSCGYFKSRAEQEREYLASVDGKK